MLCNYFYLNQNNLNMNNDMVSKFSFHFDNKCQNIVLYNHNIQVIYYFIAIWNCWLNHKLDSQKFQNNYKFSRYHYKSKINNMIKCTAFLQHNLSCIHTNFHSILLWCYHIQYNYLYLLHHRNDNMFYRKDNK